MVNEEIMTAVNKIVKAGNMGGDQEGEDASSRAGTSGVDGDGVAYVGSLRWEEWCPHAAWAEVGWL